mgnify:CR=1 FL=1
MKIYTYYQNINHDKQPELIDLWKLSWSRQGYEPIVLNLEDAKKHSYFETLDTEMRKIFKEITNKEISDYGMSCWFRWLAYATQEDEKFYVSDYDAININFPITEPSNQLHLMDNACPFLASGTPKQFENLCKAFVELSNQRIDILKQQADHYHDQEFFQYNFIPNFNDSYEDLRNQHGILMTRTRSHEGGIGDWYLPNDKKNPSPTTYGVYHVSHSNCSVYKTTNTQDSSLSAEELRIYLIKDLLKIK